MSPVRPVVAAAPPPAPAVPPAAMRERSLPRGDSLAQFLDEPEAAPAAEAPTPLAVGNLRSLGRPTIADPASVPGALVARGPSPSTPDVWDLLQDGDVLEVGDDDYTADAASARGCAVRPRRLKNTTNAIPVVGIGV
jgi:hypothetical protein